MSRPVVACMVGTWIASAVLADNNYPNSVGRHVGSGEPDDNEFIVLRVPRKLRVSPGVTR